MLRRFDPTPLRRGRHRFDPADFGSFRFYDAGNHPHNADGSHPSIDLGGGGGGGSSPQGSWISVNQNGQPGYLNTITKEFIPKGAESEGQIPSFSQAANGNWGWFVENPDGSMRMVKQATIDQINSYGYFSDGKGGWTYDPARGQPPPTATGPKPLTQSWVEQPDGSRQLTVYYEDGTKKVLDTVAPGAATPQTQILTRANGSKALINSQTGAVIAELSGPSVATGSGGSSGGGGGSSGGGSAGNYSSSTSDIGPVQDKLQRDKMAEDYKIFLMQHGLAESEATRKANEFAANLAFNKEEAIRRSEIDLGKLGLSEVEIGNQRDKWEGELGLNYERLGFEYEQLGVQDSLQRDKMGLDYTTFLMQHGLAKDEATRKGNEFSATLSFNKEEAARRQMLDLAKLGLTEVELGNQRAKWEGELGLGFGRLGLDTELGRGRLGLDYAELDLARELGLGKLGLEGELGRGRLGLDTELGRAKFASAAEQLALERELGKGKLSLGHAEVGQRAAASAAQAASEAARLGLDTELGRGRLGLDTNRLGLDRNRLGLDAAEAFVQAISSSNPLAATAMWEAGGGNLMNAYRTGATAITPEMLAVASEILATGRANTATAQPFAPGVAPPQALAPQSGSSQTFALQSFAPQGDPSQPYTPQPFADRAYIPAPGGPGASESSGPSWTPGTGMPGAGWGPGASGGGGGGIWQWTQAAIQAALAANPNSPGGAASSSGEMPPWSPTGTPYAPNWSRPPTGGQTGSGGGIAARTRAAIQAALAANAAAGTSLSPASSTAGGTPGSPPNVTQPGAPPPYVYATPGMGPDTNQGGPSGTRPPPLNPPPWSIGPYRRAPQTPAEEAELAAYQTAMQAAKPPIVPSTGTAITDPDPRIMHGDAAGSLDPGTLEALDIMQREQATQDALSIANNNAGYKQLPGGGYAMARGGMTNEPTFITGDAPRRDMFEGRPNPEMIVNPTNAPIGVVPLRNEDHAARILALIRQRLTAQRQMQQPQPPRYAWGTAWDSRTPMQPQPLPVTSGGNWGNIGSSTVGPAPTPAPEYPQTNVGIPGRDSLGTSRGSLSAVPTNDQSLFASLPPSLQQLIPQGRSRTFNPNPVIPPNPPVMQYPSIPLNAGGRGIGTTSGRGTEPTTGGPLPPEVPQTGGGSPMYDPAMAAAIANEARRNIPVPAPPISVLAPGPWVPPRPTMPIASNPPPMAGPMPAPVSSTSWGQPGNISPGPGVPQSPQSSSWTQPASAPPPIAAPVAPPSSSWTQPPGTATGPVTSYPGQPTYNPLQNDPQSLFNFRQGSYVPNINRLALYRGPQYIRDVYSQGWQNRTGAPAQGWLDELYRFRPRGLSRSGISLGI